MDKETEYTKNIEENNNHIINLSNTRDFEIIGEIPSLNNYIKIYKVLRKVDKNYYILMQYPLDIIAKTVNDFKK